MVYARAYSFIYKKSTFIKLKISTTDVAHGNSDITHHNWPSSNSLLLTFVLCSSLSFFFHVIDRRTPSPALTLFPPIFLVISLQTQASSLTPSPAICKIVSYNELQMSCKATISNSTLHMNLNRLLSITYVDPLDTGTDRPLELGAGNVCGGGDCYATFLYANTALRAVVKLLPSWEEPFLF